MLMWKLRCVINLVSMTPIGQKAEVVFWRDKQTHKAVVTVADRDTVLATEPSAPARRSESNAPLRRSPRPELHSEPNSTPNSSALGLDLLTMDASVARVYHLPENLRGVAVAGGQSPLSIRSTVQNVITSVGGQAVPERRRRVRLLTRRRGREPLEMNLQRIPVGRCSNSRSGSVNHARTARCPVETGWRPGPQ